MRPETPDCTHCTKTVADAEHDLGCPATIDGTASDWPTYHVYAPGRPPVQHKRQRPFTLEELQSIVGGYIQVIPAPGGRVCVLNEEGKLEGLERNESITATMLGYLFPGDYIVGAAIISDDKLIQ